MPAALIPSLRRRAADHQQAGVWALPAGFQRVDANLDYAAALSKLPLNVVHPILTSGAISAVAVFSVIFFREPFHWTTVTGIMFVIVGVIFITMRVA